MDVMQGLAFKCERCKSGKGVRQQVHLPGRPGQPSRNIAYTLKCLDCGLVVGEYEWVQRNAPKPK
jgi:hypothetical protein